MGDGAYVCSFEPGSNEPLLCPCRELEPALPLVAGAVLDECVLPFVVRSLLEESLALVSLPVGKVLTLSAGSSNGPVESWRPAINAE